MLSYENDNRVKGWRIYFPFSSMAAACSIRSGMGSLKGQRATHSPHLMQLLAGALTFRPMMLL
jgi:hypothetical protein